jgi:hypothetical protein
MQTQTYEILYSLMNIKNRHLSRTVWCRSKYAHFYLGGGWFESCLYTNCPKILWFFSVHLANAEKYTVIRPRLLLSTSCSSYNPQIILPSVTVCVEIQTTSRKKDLFFPDTHL